MTGTLAFAAFLSASGVRQNAPAHDKALRQDQLQVTLTPDKTAYELGEPIRLMFKVKNLSHESPGVTLIGGPPYERDIVLDVVRQDGARVQRRPLPFIDARDELRRGFSFRSGTTRTMDVFVPDHVDITQPGLYRFTCKTAISQFDLDQIVDITATAEVSVRQPDPKALGLVIDRLGNFCSRRVPRAGKYPYDSKDLASRAAQSLIAIADPRVVPWLTKMFASKRDGEQYKEVLNWSELGKSAGFDAIQFGMTLPDRYEGTIPAGEEKMFDVPAYVESGIYALGFNADTRAMPLLKSLASDPNPGVRRRVAGTLYLHHDAVSKEILLELRKDPDKDVRESADSSLSIGWRNRPM